MGRSVSAHRLTLLCGVSVALMVSMGLSAAPAYAKPSGGAATAVSHEKSMPAAKAKLTRTPRLADPPRVSMAKPLWPKGGTVSLELTAGAGGVRSGRAVVGGLPVMVSTAASELPAGRIAPAGTNAPTAVTVEVADRSATDKTGTQVALRLSRADGRGPGFTAKVQLGYGPYAQAFGADWSARLGVVTLPSCALTTPARDECRVPTRIPSDNDNAAKTVSAQVTASSADAAVVVALAAAPSSEGGDFTRTDLSQSASWQAGGSSGDFSWSYPIDVPPVPGGLTPHVSIGYSSGAVDGRTANNNVQPGWLGEGFSYDPGFIERRYRPCATDTTVTPVWADTVDQCWRMANATLAWNGHSTELIPDDASNPPNTAMPTVWHLADDDGTKVEYLSDDGSAATQNWHDEHWRLTTKDGTQYWFGLSFVPGTVTRTNSVQGMPVLSNHTGEPCFSSSSIANSWCSMAYRWNLDYVVDPHGDSMIYSYAKEQNFAHMPGTAGNGRTYDRASYPTKIEYGLRAGQEASMVAPGRIVFTVDDRCWPQAGSTCAAHDGGDWPDVPWDLQQPSNGATDPPTFFTSKRLSRIDAQITPYNQFTYHTIDTYGFDSTVFGTGHSCCGGVLNLRSIDHDGVDGSTVDLIPVYFGYGAAMQNRAAFVSGSGAEESWKFRLRQVTSESGAQTNITYQALDSGCLDGNNPPDPDNNYSRCFPQPYGGWTWWHKYVVSAVSEHDGTGASATDMTHSYSYARSATVGAKTVGTSSVLWHHDMDTFSADLPGRSWNQWAGYPVVTEISGTGSGAGQSKTMRLYWTGLDGDRTDAGDGARHPVLLIDTESDTAGDHRDYGYRAGQIRETITFDGNTNTVLSKTVTDSTGIQTGQRSIPAAWGASYLPYAFIPIDTAQNTYTWIANSSTWRRTYTGWAYDNLGNLTSIDAQGDVATSTDDTCTTTTYLTNPLTNLYRYDGASATTLNSTPLSIDPNFGYTFSTATNDFTGDGKKDVIVRTSAGRIYVNPGTGTGTYGTGTLISTGFGSFRSLAVADFTGDGKPDIVGNLPDDRLLMYPGNGTGGIGSSVQIGTSGWAPYDDLFSPGDMTGDGRADLVGRRYSDGKLFLWPVTGNGSVGTAQPIGTSGWDLFTQVFGNGDYTGDGKADVLAADASGVWVYPGSGTATVTLGARVALISGAIGPQTDWYLPTGDITGDGKPDLLTRQLRYLVALPSTVHTVGKVCGAAVTYPTDAVADSRYYYDQPGVTAPNLSLLPLAGDVTRTERATGYSGSTPLWISAGETTAIDGFGRPTAVKDPRGKLTTTAYGTVYLANLPQYRKTTVTDPLGYQTVTATTYGRGLPVWTTDPNGKTTNATYDGLGRLLQMWKPGHATSGTPDAEYAYHVDGITSPPFVTAKTVGPDGTSQITSYQLLDGFLRNRQTQSPTADGKRGITDTQYDSRGLVVRSATLLVDGVPAPVAVAITDANATSQHRFSYDGLARQTRDELWSQLTPFWNTALTSYDGDRITVDYPDGGTDTTTIVDALGRTSQVWQYSGPTPSGSHTVTSYSYEPAGNLVSETGPDGAVWTYDYDLLGRKTSTVDPDTGTASTSYDEAGNVVEVKNGRGQYLSFDYDDLGRKRAEYTAQLQNKAAANQVAGWLYDNLAKGQLDSATRYVGGSQPGGVAYVRAITDYDNEYRPEHVDLTIPSAEGALAGVYGTDYSYKANGAPATQTATTKAGAAVGGLPLETLTFTYDSVGQQTGLAGNQTYLASAAYTYDGQIAEQILGTGSAQVRHTYSYSGITRRLDASTVYTGTTGSWTTKAIDTYSRDAAGNVLGIVTSTNGATDQMECFRYDFLRRLTDAWTEAGYPCATSGTLSAGVDPYRRSWTYDAPGGDPLKSAGLRATETAYNPNGTTQYQSTYSYGGTNKPKHSLASITTTGTGAGTKTYDYDQSGNTTSRPGPGGAQQTLTWDGENRLAKVSDSTDTTFLYDADGTRLIRRDPGGYATLTLTDGTELRANGAGSVAGTRYYANCASRTANTNSSGDLTGGTTLTWNVSDEHGTGSIAVNATTLQVDRRRSLPFGGPRGTQPSGFGTKGFVGGTSDPTGLVHLGAREYDPATGRFVSVDPLFDNTNPQSWNGYAYAGNAPATNSDPGGLWFPKPPDVPGPGHTNPPPSGGGGGTPPGGGKPGGGKPGGGGGNVLCTPGYYNNCPSKGLGDRQFCAKEFVGPCTPYRPPHNRCEDLDMSSKHCPFPGGTSVPAACGTAAYLVPCPTTVTTTPPAPATSGTPDSGQQPLSPKGKLLGGIVQSLMFGYVGDQVLGEDMGGLCVNGTVSLVFLAGVSSGCVAADNNGIGWTASDGGGEGFGYGFSETGGVIVSNGDIPDQAGQTFVVNPALGFGGRVDGFAAQGMQDGHRTKTWSAGLNIGGTAGATVGNVSGTTTKTGYWFSWDDLVFW